MRTPAYEKKIAAVVAAQSENNAGFEARLIALEREAKWQRITTVVSAGVFFLVALCRLAIWLLERAR